MAKQKRKTKAVVTPPKAVEIQSYSAEATYYPDDNEIKLVGQFWVDDPEYGMLTGRFKVKSKVRPTPQPDPQESVGV